MRKNDIGLSNTIDVNEARYMKLIQVSGNINKVIVILQFVTGITAYLLLAIHLAF